MQNKIVNERDKTHGDFRMQLGLVAELHGAIRDLRSIDHPRDTRLDHCVEMIALKLSRITCGDPTTEDHWDDIIGYAEIAKQLIVEGRDYDKYKDELRVTFRAPEGQEGQKDPEADAPGYQISETGEIRSTGDLAGYSPEAVAEEEARREYLARVGRRPDGSEIIQESVRSK